MSSTTITPSVPTLGEYRGMDAATGLSISGEAHLLQSERDILTTPLGSRVMLRDYGSRVPFLVDAPAGGARIADVVAAGADALLAWEPRATLTRVRVQEVAGGGVTIDLEHRVNGAPLKLEGVV